MIYIIAVLGGVICALLFLQHQRELRWDAERSLLLDRLMARSFEQFKATAPPDAYLEASPWVPQRKLYDQTGLLEVELEDADRGNEAG